MNQRSLFDQPARITDPATSQRAADEIRPKLAGLRAEFVQSVQTWQETFHNWPTANEASRGRESLRKRAKECVEQGWLKVGPIKRCSQTGKLAQTYVY